MGWSDPIQDKDLELANLETMIASAGDFILPTDDLRPRTLDAARVQADHANRHRQLGAFLVCSLLLLSTCIPVVDYLGSIQSRLRGPTSDQLQKIAQDPVSYGAEGVTWGLVEAMTQWRRSQAEYLGHADRHEF